MCDSPLTAQPTQRWDWVKRNDDVLVHRLLTDVEIQRVRREEARLANYRQWVASVPPSPAPGVVMAPQCKWQHNWFVDNERRRNQSIETGKPIYPTNPVMTAAQVAPKNNNACKWLLLGAAVAMVVIVAASKRKQ